MPGWSVCRWPTITAPELSLQLMNPFRLCDRKIKSVGREDRTLAASANTNALGLRSRLLFLIEPSASVLRCGATIPQI